MYQLLIFLACCLLLAAAVPEQPEEMATTGFPFGYDYDFSELSEPSEQEKDVIMAQKINWLPIAQGAEDGLVLARQARDVEKVEQMEHIEPSSTTAKQQLEATTHEGDACPSSSERGLTSLIRNARALLPVDRLRNIVANARQDAEVRDLLKLLRSDQFKEQVMRLRSTKEEGVLRDYVCQALKLNHAYYIEFVRVLFDARDLVESASSSLPNRRKGVRGLLQDLRDALPRAELRDLYRRQLSADKELAAAVRRLRGVEFRRLLGNVRALPEYRAVRNDLQKVGVPLQQLLNLVANALGWGALDLGSELDILNA